MFDDPAALFVEGGLEAFNLFCRSLESPVAGGSKDLRLGLDAALALFHLREHVPWTRGKWPDPFTQSADYELLSDIVNVTKHGPRREGAVAKPSDIYELTILTEYEDERGPYQDIERIVAVELRSGGWRDLREVLTAVVNLWIAEFHSHSLLLHLQPIRPTVRPIPPPRQSLSGAAREDLRLLQGIRFRHQFRLRKFNYTTGLVEEIDVSRHRYVLNITKPTSFVLTLRNDETGQTIEIPITLSAEEDLEYQRLKGDDERREFEKALALKVLRR